MTLLLCSATANAQDGACCGSGGCNITDETDCVDNQRGTFLGSSTSCSGVDCSGLVGACCASGLCVPDTTPLACSDAGGIFLGLGTSCTFGSSCSDTTGACCPSGPCLDSFSQFDCELLGWTYAGDGTNCTVTPNPCGPQPARGACCFPDNCVDDATADGCTGATGLYEGDDTECATALCQNCGDNVVQSQFGEECDGTADSACTCSSCYPPGHAQECTCAPDPVCGNNVVEECEVCDGTDDAACLAGCDVDCTCLPQPLTVSWFSMDGGGGTSTGGTFKLRSTIGQHDAGDLSGGTYVLRGGFWSPSAPACPASSQPQRATLIASGTPQADAYSTNRFLPVRLTDVDGVPRNIEVTAVNLPPPHAGSACDGQTWWAAAPYPICEKASQGDKPGTSCQPVPGEPKGRNHNWYADLVCDQNLAADISIGTCDTGSGLCVGGFAAGDPCSDDSHCQTLYLKHECVVPSARNDNAVYDVRAIANNCPKEQASSFSPALAVTQDKLGNLVGVGVACENPAPDAAVGLPDVNALLAKFANAPCQIKKARGDLRGPVGGAVDNVVSLPDINAALFGFTNPTALNWSPPANACGALAATWQEDDGALAPVSAAAPLEAIEPVDPERIASLRLVPDRTVVTPGGLVTVDVFVDRVLDMQGYQLALDVSGGNAGVLTVEDLWVDLDRADHALDQGKGLDAVDLDGKRLLATQIHGATSIDSAAYLASFQLRASDDASGEFTIDLRWDDTLLMTPAGELIRATVDGPASMWVEPKVHQRRLPSR